MQVFVWKLDFIARLACTLSIANTLSPAPTFLFALKNKEKVESISSAYLATGLISAIIWLMYGEKKRDMSLILANGAALTVLLLYIFTLHYLNSHWKKALPILYFSLFSLTILGLFASSYFLGQLGALLNILQTLAMASSLIPAIKFKDPKYINLTVTLFSGVVQSVWAVYGHLVRDNFIYIPSLFSLIIALLQIFIYMWTVGIFNPSAIPDSETILQLIKRRTRSLFSNFLKSLEKAASSFIQFVKSLRKWLKPQLLLKQACTSVKAEPKQLREEETDSIEIREEQEERKQDFISYGTLQENEGTVFVSISGNEPVTEEN